MRKIILSGLILSFFFSNSLLSSPQEGEKILLIFLFLEERKQLLIAEMDGLEEEIQKGKLYFYRKRPSFLPDLKVNLLRRKMIRLQNLWWKKRYIEELQLDLLLNYLEWGEKMLTFKENSSYKEEILDNLNLLLELLL